MNKRNYLVPVVNFLKKFGKVSVNDLLEQINHDMLYVKVSSFGFYFRWENGWKLLSITQEQV